ERVDAARLEIGHQSVEVAERGGALGAGLERLLDLRGVEDPAAIALDVDDHRVQFGALGQREDAGADPAVADAEVSEVRGFHGPRLEDDLDRAALRRDRDLLVTGQLDEERLRGRHALQAEGALEVGPVFDTSRDHRGALDRLTLGVEHPTRDGAAPRRARRRLWSLERR